MGNTMHCSEGVLVDETANTWVGNKRDDGDDERTGTDNAPGRWLFGRNEGRWEGARADIPASICGVSERRLLRMYSGETPARSGDTASIALGETSE
jgi:hypothetical protein